MIAIIAGMIITIFWNDKSKAENGIKFASKYILQAAVVFLGFGLNLGVVFQTGKRSCHPDSAKSFEQSEVYKQRYYFA